MPTPVNRRWREKVDGGLARIGRLLFPPRCLLCAEPGDGDRDLCRDCFAALPWNLPSCARCGLPLAAAADACGDCLRQPPPFTLTTAVWRYGFPVDRLLPRFKFHADLAAGRQLAELMLPVLRFAPRPQALLPVPLHRQRLRERGYDQALELAKPLARALALPLLADGLRRGRRTDAQSGLGAAARRRNVRGAFVALRRGAWPAHVALLDDVMTTGATLRECAQVLLGAGVQRVDVWVAARAPAPPAR